MLTDVPAEALVISEEVFGPVVSIMPFIQVADASTPPTTPTTGFKPACSRSRSSWPWPLPTSCTWGAVVINETSDVRIDSMPFGGFKKSGVGREGVKHAVREMTEPKSTIIKLAEPATRWQKLTATSERNAS